MTERSIFRSAAGLIAVTIAFGPTSMSPASAGSSPVKRVSMIHFTFSPANVVISRGTIVRWTYDERETDPQPNCESPYFQASVGVPVPYYEAQLGPMCPGHSTTAVDRRPDAARLWDSGVARASGFPYSMRFTKRGSYRYYCAVHGGDGSSNPLPRMEGLITVR